MPMKILGKIKNLVLNLFIVSNIKQNEIRKVYFGLKTRFIGLISLAMLIIIFFIAVAMNITQTSLLRKEKNNKAKELVQILSGTAEHFLDYDTETSRVERLDKYRDIQREAENFKKYNADIIKIMLVNKDTTIRYSTIKDDENKKYQFSYFLKTLEQNEEKPLYKNIKIKYKDKKPDRLKAVTYPIFLHKGRVFDILEDFKKYYNSYEALNITEKRKIYLSFWQNYSDMLGKDYDPKLNPAPDPKIIPDKVNYAWDMDFLFVKLFAEIYGKRKTIFKKKDDFALLSYKWLLVEKRKILNARINQNLSEITKSNELINEKMNYLYEQMLDAKKLGAVAILFDVKKIREDISKNINIVLIIMLIIFILSIIIFFFVVDLIIKNLKKLETWAIEISEGNLDDKIEIPARDEIGRLSDIFNKMIDELKTKFHLEKFVSNSTRSMIKQKKDSKSSIITGKMGKKSFAFIFSDVRGFTSFSEQNDPSVVIETLNLYFELQSKIIKSKKGDIDDYVGDEIMAHFGGAKRADTAIKAALEIASEIKKLNEDRKHKNLPYFEIGIGIHGGDVVVGNIGSSFRMDFACIGDAVNLSSRLCSSAKPGEILISKELFKKAKGKYKIQEIPDIPVKGKAKKIPVYRLLL